jgi:internalin A
VADADAADAESAAGYGGEVRIRAKGAGAGRLRDVLLERLENLNQQHGWTAEPLAAGAQAVHPGQCVVTVPGQDAPDAYPLTPSDPPPIPPGQDEVYISFAWKQERAEPLVDTLIDSLGGYGIRVLRDSDQLQPGDRISAFMKRLSAGRCVLLVLSEAYLRSPFCMTELHGIWVNARQREDELLRRIVPLVQPDAGIGTIAGRIAHAAHWKAEYEALDALLRQHGAEVMGIGDFQRFKAIGDFYRHVSDMLSFADDVLVPRDRMVLSADGFAVVRDLIRKALR